MNITQIPFVEKASASDVDQILRIADDCNLSFWSKNDYLDEIERKSSFIKAARIGEIAVGFLIARFNIPNCEESADRYVAEADILNIGVLRSFQKQGIGQMLLNDFFYEAKKLKVQNIWLEVRESNINARAFYERNGFIEFQKRSNFYSNPIENAILMKLDLARGTENKNTKT